MQDFGFNEANQKKIKKLLLLPFLEKDFSCGHLCDAVDYLYWRLEETLRTVKKIANKWESVYKCLEIFASQDYGTLPRTFEAKKWPKSHHKKQKWREAKKERDERNETFKRKVPCETFECKKAPGEIVSLAIRKKWEKEWEDRKRLNLKKPRIMGNSGEFERNVYEAI